VSDNWTDPTDTGLDPSGDGLDPGDLEPDPSQNPQGSPLYPLEPDVGIEEAPGLPGQDDVAPGLPGHTGYVPEGTEPVVAEAPAVVAGDLPPWVEAHGDAEAAGYFWEPQSVDGLCVDVSVGMVIAQLTGTELTEQQLAEAAVGLGIQTVSAEGAVSGIGPNDVVKLVEHFGLDAERYTDLSVEDLQNLLDGGLPVIVGVDSSEVWEYVDDDAKANGFGADHAVVVTGIETDDTGRTVVFLNDPGNAQGGRGYPIPLEVFLDAWHDSDETAIIATPDAATTASIEEALGLQPATDAAPDITGGAPTPAAAAGAAASGAPSIAGSDDGRPAGLALPGAAIRGLAVGSVVLLPAVLRLRRRG
jgi:hypothetical protein